MTPVRVGQRRVWGAFVYEVVGETEDGRYRIRYLDDGFEGAPLKAESLQNDRLLSEPFAANHRSRVTAGPSWMRFDLGGAR